MPPAKDDFGVKHVNLCLSHILHPQCITPPLPAPAPACLSYLRFGEAASDRLHVKHVHPQLSRDGQPRLVQLVNELLFAQIGVLDI